MDFFSSQHDAQNYGMGTGLVFMSLAAVINALDVATENASMPMWIEPLFATFGILALPLWILQDTARHSDNFMHDFVEMMMMAKGGHAIATKLTNHAKENRAKRNAGGKHAHVLASLKARKGAKAAKKGATTANAPAEVVEVELVELANAGRRGVVAQV